MHTFETFVVSKRSRAAWKAALAVVDDPAHAPNPLFLVGPVGSGKSHLLIAIEEALRARRPEAKVVRTATATLIDRIIHAIRVDTPFAEDADVLLLDDLGLAVAGKENTEKEIHRQIDKAVLRGAQVVVASDKAPLRGAVVQIGYPDQNARIEIVRSLAESRGLALPPERLRALAGRSLVSPRVLQNAIARLAADALSSRA